MTAPLVETMLVCIRRNLRTTIHIDLDRRFHQTAQQHPAMACRPSTMSDSWPWPGELKPQNQ
jgi:hypothetical protein